MESGTGSMVRVNSLKETHSHSPLNKMTHYFSVSLHRISGPDQGLNARFWFSIYSQHSCLFHPHSCPGSSFCVFGRLILGNLSLYPEGTGDLDQHPGCLHAAQWHFQIPCCHFEKKFCVEFKHKKWERNKSHCESY